MGQSEFWQISEECYLLDCFVATVQFGGGRRTLWGCFSGFGVCRLLPVKGSLNTSIYQEIF